MLAKDYLEKNYPKNKTCIRKESGKMFEFKGREEFYSNYGKRRHEITHLDISRMNLTGTLDLSDFVSLVELDCHNHDCSEIILPAKVKLTRLFCANISSFKDCNLRCLFSLNTEKLTTFRPGAKFERILTHFKRAEEENIVKIYEVPDMY
jgi:hypothetical protein